ncbi:MAG TPA: TraR/DksA C4-type zinc finger protein [Streptomyces sp.]|uniref:TraR/DksA family transcriptional regulator n=1 Tax=Streptomyces sp. TaxID=1931 RepID=UPI002D5CE8A2|nr:TraR/DksA C4-type zinc finger protein [Streptomyces sp.]HZG03344.1 TraR/DksA C4-type zinc finger protein [Streptomyces sp.]
MTIDAARAEDPPERLTAHDARQLLEHERTSRLSQLAAVENDEHHAADDLMAVQAAAVRRVLKEIDAAFERLDRGTYGTCQDCGTAIPAERLEILPYARCCVGCQRRTA